MRVTIHSLIKSGCIRTDPAAETKSIGLSADALVPHFLCSYRDYFIATRNFTAVYLDLVSSRNFTVTLSYSAIYQDWQKTSHRDPPAGGPATNQTAGPLASSEHEIRLSILIHK